MTSTAPPPIDTRYANKALLQELITRLEAVTGRLDVLEGAGDSDLPYKFKTAVVAGAGTATNIAVSGIATADHLIGVVQLDVAVDTGTSATGNKVQDAANLTSEAAITSAGNIQLTTTVTTGDKLLVIYYDVSATSP